MPPPPTFDVPFVGGISTKFPPNLVPGGALLQAWDTSMRKQGRIEKRWGSQSMRAPPQTSLNWCDAFGIGIPGSTELGNELLISGPVGHSGTQQHGWSPATAGWLQKGTVQPIACTTKTAFASSFDCQSTDLALNFNTPIAGGSYGCYVYETPNGINFTVVDDKSGQTVMPNQLLAAGDHPRVVSIGPFFCIFYADPSLTLWAVTVDPAQRSVSVYNMHVSANFGAYDARAVTNASPGVGHAGNYVAVAYSVAGGGCAILGFDPWNPGSGIAPVPFGGTDIFISLSVGVFPTNVGVICNDVTANELLLQWFDLELTAIGGLLEVDDPITAYDGVVPGAGFGKATLIPNGNNWVAFWETLATQDQFGNFTIAPAVRTVGGSAGVAPNVIGSATYYKRGVSIAADAFTLGGQVYLPAVYQGNYYPYQQMQSLQPTYFLLLNGVEVERLAQENAGGPTLRKMCPQVSVDLAGNYVWGIGLGTQQTASFNGAYQNVRAVARAVTTFGVQQFSATLGDNLHMTGGFLSAYDGARFTEHNFHVTPEPARVDACNIACCRVQIGVGSAGGGIHAFLLIRNLSLSGSGVLFTAVAPGTPGNLINVAYITATGLSPNAIAVVSGNNITVETTADVSTDNDVIAAIAANPAATALVTATLAGTVALVGPEGPLYLAGGGTSGTTVSYTFPTRTTGGDQQFAGTATVPPFNASSGSTAVPVAPGTVVVVSSAELPAIIGRDVSGTGAISGAGTGYTVTGSINYATGQFSFELLGTPNPDGVVVITWALSAAPLPEINDVYFPPDAPSPGSLVSGSGWQILPSSAVVITAQATAHGAGTPYMIGGVAGGPVGYVWFSVDGVGADPLIFSGPVAGANVQCALLSTDSAAACAGKFRQTIMNSVLAEYVFCPLAVQNVIPPTGGVSATSKVTIICTNSGASAPGTAVTYTEDMRLDAFWPSAASLGAGSWMSCCAGNKIMPGGYYVVPNGNNTVAVFYFQVSYDGGGTYQGLAPDPAAIVLPPLTGIGTVPTLSPANPLPIQVYFSDSAPQVAQKVFSGMFGAVPGYIVVNFVGTYDSFLQITVANPATDEYLTPYSVSSAGILPDGLYEYSSCWEWNDAKGQLHQSGTSEQEIVNIQGASPTFDPFGVRYDAAGSLLLANPNGHGMLLAGSQIGGSSPRLYAPSLWATQKQNSTLALYRTTVSPGSPPAFRRATDQAELVPPPVPTSALPNPDPTNPNTIVLDLQTFIDTTPDSQLAANATLYTNGGVAPNAPVPSCSYLHVHRGRLWAVSAENPNQLWPSNGYTPESQFSVEFATEFIEDVDPSLGQCVSLGSCDDKLIELCQNGLFYVTGDGPSVAGVGDFNPPQRIMCEVGCIAPGSVLETFDGFWWQSPNGLYFCDRNLIASYRGAPAEALVQGRYCQAAEISPNGQTELRFFLVSSPGQANPTTDYCVTYNWVTNWWAASRKFAANSACIWYPPAQAPTLVFVDSRGAVKQETPNHYLDDGAAVSRTIQTSWWGSQGTGSRQGYFMMPEGLIVGTFGNMPTPITSQIQVLIGFDFELPSNLVVWDSSALLAPPANSPQAQGDGMVAQFRFFIPVGPRGGTMESISFTLSDIVNRQTPDDPGFAFELMTCEIIPLGGTYRLGPLRTTG